MSSIISKKLQEALKAQFKAFGFKKKGASWACAEGELAKWFNIQCSRNSGCVYFNVGIYFQATKEVDYPKELDCHLRFRFEQLLSSDEEIRDFYRLSDFESGLNTEAKITRLTNLIASKLIPFFNQYNSVTDILNSDKIRPHMYWNNGKEIAIKLCA
ncbi:MULTISPECIES: DUF4304 domain-containing protein [Pseudoalteromonas]|jgi:hypothetical protein|nr:MULTISPECIES: DUF4304 domain-containing protein [Pseudoalteromonas]MBB1294815.1 DUF4304 domain-containing protein [Pseudoalteromonas sp. SR41-4]MBB1302699.1 DUF4304 domain-containing protein [Pseudoalteromonas sp. SR44-8]MBB1399171.1 DUF4304 domain-containing protein [Pseudoalteromonas sp. SG44-8]MBB1407583.1 DUF4304 domain-containing protein [Pseudoalteromonas sp. SG44-17]MBB1503917.1 DUF4304 domain-containing protein [Pseudoalteromonas sp. SG41-1]|tara:strand:- start:922 stop:1392 length:471 start_codon:yes stop_codon:yes gene_type:complete